MDTFEEWHVEQAQDHCWWLDDDWCEYQKEVCSFDIRPIKTKNSHRLIGTHGKTIINTPIKKEERRMPLPIEFEFKPDETVRCKGKVETDKVDCEGEYFGNIVVGDQRWAIVLWDNEEDPDLYKADLLLIENKRWEPIS